MMLRNVFALAMVLGVAIAPMLADAPNDLSGEAKLELKTLEGSWRIVKILFSDREATPDGLVFAIKGDTIDFDRSATGAVVALDSATDPKCLDFKMRVEFGVLKKDSTYESVFKRDGDTLTWAFYYGRGKNRPTAFDKPTDPKAMVIVLNRVKE
jgi:uncharacterized protein (TIGR03067 family)